MKHEKTAYRIKTIRTGAAEKALQYHLYAAKRKWLNGMWMEQSEDFIGSFTDKEHAELEMRERLSYPIIEEVACYDEAGIRRYDER